MHPIGGRVQSPRWVALGTDRFVAWLLECHDDQKVFLRVYAHMTDMIDKLELAGPAVDRKWAKKLRDHDGLGEIRYNDGGSRAFRAFFRFGRQGARRVIVFGDGDSKTSDDFSRERYERANRLILEEMDEHGITTAQDW